MLLIDGVKYYEWTDLKEVEEFHPLVKDHIKEIFGINSKFIEGGRLQSGAGKGSQPDGLVLIFGNEPQWHIIEMELSSHQLYDHIVNQVGRFINGIENSRKRIIDTIYHEITENKIIKAEVEEAIDSGEIYKYLTDLISKPPVLTIVIEKKTPELEEAINLLRYSPIRIIEFRTFIREGAESVHAHLYEPIKSTATVSVQQPIQQKTPQREKIFRSKESMIAGKVTFQELIDAGLLKDGQVLYFYNTELFKDERVQVIASSNSLRYEKDGRSYSKSDLATILLKQHGFTHSKWSVRGPLFWISEEGKRLIDLENELRKKRVERK